MESGYCLVSQQIRDLVESGVIRVSGNVEKRIQPASFDPVLGEECFILDTEGGLFRPRVDKTVYGSLLEMPKQRRQRVDISSGFEVKRGFTYLLPLEERVSLGEFTHITSSPKSSRGREFPDTRLVADYHQCFDQINRFPDSLQLWLLLQPKAFNAIIAPGMSFNQLRFFNGNARLSSLEVGSEWDKQPMLFRRSSGELVPMNLPLVAENFQLGLDLTGEDTYGIVALRARENPVPIDLRKKIAKSEDYFEPLMARDKTLVIEPGRHYLMTSHGVLRIPPHLSAHLGDHSSLGIRGTLHRAGFIDPGFEGDIVYEITSEEPTSVNLHDGMPIASLDFFRNSGVPDKLYGKKAGSHYFGQIGPRVSKTFSTFNYPYAAKHYPKLDKMVLVQDRNVLLAHRKSDRGFEFMSPEDSAALFKDLQDGFFHSRYDCEKDELVLQPAHYVVICGPNETVFEYRRASDIKHYRDRRLFGKRSVGIGGHIIKRDGPNYIENSLNREIEEEVRFDGSRREPKFVGTLFSRRRGVDRVHFGLVYSLASDGNVVPNEKSIPFGKMRPIDGIRRSLGKNEDYETWSRLLIPHLKDIYRNAF